MIGQFTALDTDGRLPGHPAVTRLKIPFQEMGEQHCQPVHEFPPLASTHALDFLGDMLDVGGGELAGTQQRRLFFRPGVKITLVKARVRDRHDDTRP